MLGFFNPIIRNFQCSTTPCLLFKLIVTYDNKPISYLSLMIQKTTKLLVRIYLKKKPCAGFVWLNCVKEVRLSRWSAAAKVNLL